MPLAVEIREVRTAEELDQVRELFRGYRNGLPPHLQFPDTEWKELPGPYSRPGGVLLHATVAGQSAGCAGLRPFPLERTCEIKRLFVSPQFRGHKLGYALMIRVLNVARELGYRRVRLDTHLATMGAAVELYRQFGFVEVEADPMPPVAGLCYMELSL
jgi:carbonic anhydrase